jgi:predicted transcriptional regulator
MVSDQLMRKYLAEMPNEPASLRTLAKRFNTADSNARRVLTALESFGLVELVHFETMKDGRTKKVKGYKKIVITKSI